MASKRGGARRGSGPKPKPADELRRNRVVLLLTDDEHAALVEAAGEESLPGYARAVLLRAVRRRRTAKGG